MERDNIIKKIIAFLWELGAKVICKIDDFLDWIDDLFIYKVGPYLREGLEECKEISRATMEFLIDIGAAIIVWWDITADIIEWFTKKTYATLANKNHLLKLKIVEHKKTLIYHGALLLIVGVAVISLFDLAVDYEYSYNGRALGIVKEQRDVLEILDLISEELSLEYGSSVIIDSETDISFRPVISYGKEIDDADTVLRRFTYMGDIQVDTCVIKADGEAIAIVDSENTANEVLSEIQSKYIDKKKKYESVDFVEDIAIEPYNTILARVSSKSAAVKKIKSGGQKKQAYKVEEGDTLYGICEKMGISLEELQEMNPKVGEDIVLHVGDEFVIQKEVPLLTVKTVEITSFAESIDYKTVKKESSKYYKGDKIVKTKGKKGKAKITARLTKNNGETVDRENLKKEVIQEPVDKVIITGTREKPSTEGTGAFRRPVDVAVYRGYGMRWGRMHYGLDYAAPIGTSIHASDGGVVIKAGWSGAYGNLVEVDHGGGFTTFYAHCNQFYVSVGDRVYKGQTIASVGNTGRSTGPHCHFEIRKNGTNVNPAAYV